MGVQQTWAHTKLKMKFLVLLAAVGYASAASSNAVTCEECQAGAAGLVDHLLTDASLAEQGEFVKALVCPQLPVSTHTLSWKVMSAPCWVSARRSPSSPHVTGLARNALTSLPELLPTCPRTTPLPWVLSTRRETASVVRMDTLMTALTWYLLLFLLPCQSLLISWWSKLLNFAQRLSAFARLQM